TWSSSNAAVATVDAAGLSKAVGAGSAAITATAGGKRGLAQLVVVAVAPGTVKDLAVGAATDTSATLSFTEVDDGTGKPASYDVRAAVHPLTWWSAASVARGTCATPVAGTAIGAKRSCTVLGLVASTAYD